MRRPLFPLLTAAALAGIALTATAQPSAPQPDYRVRADFTDNVGPVNRSLFSVVNYQRTYSEINVLGRHTVSALNLAGTQARTETMIHRMEPTNDNGDASIFDWSGFNTDSMFRFVDSGGDEFYADMLERGMEPIALLTYNVSWLARDGRPADPPKDNEEWAEFAAAVVEHLNGHGEEEDYEPRVDYVEVWNEPSVNGPYWTGSRQDYIDLFNVVADRIHEDYPHVAVLGPSVLGSHGQFMIEFIEKSGDRADYFTIHLYNERPYLTVRKMTDWTRYIREQTGREEAKLIVTEGDNWRIDGPEKLQYLFIRQFELTYADEFVHGFHQFSLPYYVEDRSRVFGLVRPDGRVVDKNYWPYWFFRKYTGRKAPVAVFDGGAPEEADAAGDAARLQPESRRREPMPFYAVASRGSTPAAPTADTSTLFLYNNTDEPQSVEVSLTLQPAAGPRLVKVERVAPYRHGLTRVETVEGGATEFRTRLDVPGLTAYSLTTVPVGAAAGPEITVNIDATEPERAGITLFNNTGDPVRGRVELHEVPGDTAFGGLITRTDEIDLAQGALRKMDIEIGELKRGAAVGATLEYRSAGADGASDTKRAVAVPVNVDKFVQ